MRPFFMCFKQGGKAISVNMNNVCWMGPHSPSGTIMTFAATVNDDPAYIIVDDDFDQIEGRSDWVQR